MANKFKPGDTVRLTSGGPVMTVEGPAREKLDMLWCVWFFNFICHGHSFAPAALVAAEPESELKAYESASEYEQGSKWKAHEPYSKDSKLAGLAMKFLTDCSEEDTLPVDLTSEKKLLAYLQEHYPDLPAPE
jgi:uncharacterized protein YodC (DUF2158 family)